jgi:hypothetical protein
VGRIHIREKIVAPFELPQPRLVHAIVQELVMQCREPEQVILDALADFAQNLAADRAAITDVEETENNADNEGVQNTAAIGRLVSEGMKECNYLDAIFHNVYARNAEKLRAWLSASHLERAPQREKTSEPPTPPTPPSA